MSESEKQVELLKRKVERERAARNSAEVKLEEYSRKIYHANESLKANLLKTNERQADLEFLHRMSSTVNSNLAVSELLNETTKLIGQFIKADIATWAYCSTEGIIKSETPRVWHKGNSWHIDENEFSLFMNLIDLGEKSSSPQWSVTPLDENEVLSQHFGTATYLKIPYTDTVSYMVGFICASNEIQPEALFVLDTAKDHLFSGMKRRAADHNIKQRNQQLEETIKDLELTQAQLIQSEKMASLGQLAAGVAHEINNPIGYIRSNLEVLGEYHQTFTSCFDLVNERLAKEDIDKKALLALVADFDIGFLLSDAQAILSTNLSGIDRVKTIVDGLKTFSHAGENKQVVMSLNQCIETALKMVKNEFKYQHTIVNEMSIDTTKIVGNLAQLQQVFVNLFINAAAAMPEGGILKLSSRELDHSVEICVSDTGVGMSEETKKNVFTPFFTTKPVGSGTGLGLSISMGILDAHNVIINVESKLDIGTTFSLVFPTVEDFQ